MTVVFYSVIAAVLGPYAKSMCTKADMILLVIVKSVFRIVDVWSK